MQANKQHARWVGVAPLVSFCASLHPWQEEKHSGLAEDCSIASLPVHLIFCGSQGKEEPIPWLA